MEESRLYVEQRDKTKAILPEWCEHRVKVEAELRELARQFDEWEVEAVRTAISSIAESSAAIADDNTVGLLEQDRILTSDLIEAVEALKEKEALFLDKIDFGNFNENRNFFLPADTNANALINLAVEGLLCRCVVSHQLRTYADDMKKWHNMRRLMMEYLGVPENQD